MARSRRSTGGGRGSARRRGSGRGRGSGESSGSQPEPERMQRFVDQMATIIAGALQQVIQNLAAVPHTPAAPPTPPTPGITEPAAPPPVVIPPAMGASSGSVPGVGISPPQSATPTTPQGQERANLNKGKKRVSTDFTPGQSDSGKGHENPRSQRWREKRPGQSSWKNAPGENSQRQRPLSCIFCSRNHLNKECPQRHGKCFGCGQAGHMRANCPHPIICPIPLAVAPPLPPSPSPPRPSADT